MSLAKEANLAKGLQRSRKKKNEIPVPRSFNQLKIPIQSTPEQNPHLPKAGIRIFLIPTGVPDEPDIIFFANPEFIALFIRSLLWCIDGTFNVVPFVDGLKQSITNMAEKWAGKLYTHSTVPSQLCSSSHYCSFFIFDKKYKMKLFYYRCSPLDGLF